MGKTLLLLRWGRPTLFGKMSGHPRMPLWCLQPERLNLQPEKICRRCQSKIGSKSGFGGKLIQSFLQTYFDDWITGSDIWRLEIRTAAEAVCRDLCAVIPNCNTSRFIGFGHKLYKQNKSLCALNGGDRAFGRESNDRRGSSVNTDFASFVA